MKASDHNFFKRLYYSSRHDISYLHADEELQDKILEQQFKAFETGIHTQYPGAQYFIAEQFGNSVGSFIVDFGHNEVRLIYIAVIPELHGKGIGSQLVQGIQKASATARAPLAVIVMKNNQQAQNFYRQLGFQLQETSPVAERYIWYKGIQSQGAASGN